MSASPDFLQQLLSQGDPDAPGLLGMINKGTAPFGGAGNLGLQLLANSGYSTAPRTTGSVFAQSALNAQQVAAGAQEQQLKQQLLQQQIAALKAKPAVNPVSVGEGSTLVDPTSGKVIYQGAPKASDQPPDVREYEYALKNGFKGSFEDWANRKASLGSSDVQGYKLAQGQGYKGSFVEYMNSVHQSAAQKTMNDPRMQAAQDAQAKAIAAYKIPLPTGGLSMQRNPELYQKVLDLNPDFDSSIYPARQKSVSAFSTGKQGDQVRSFNVGISHLNTASDLAQALGNGDIRIFNKISQEFAEQTGSAAPTNLDTAKEVIKAEIVKAISGAGGGVGDRERALAGIDKASSPAQLQGAIEVAKKLMGGQLGGLRRQYESSTRLHNFEDMLSADAIPYLSTPEGRGSEASDKGSVPLTNAKGWVLHTDKNGNKAYVSPDGSQYEEAK